MSQDRLSARGARRRMGLGFTIAAWALLLLLLAWLGGRFLDVERNPNHDPSSGVAADGRIEVALRHNSAGHYLVDGAINARGVVFLVDTGATLVAVDERLAARLGLVKGVRRPMQTANGLVEGWTTLIGTLAIAGLTQHAVPGVILPDLGDEVLLGMSFLKRVEMVQRDGVLILRGPS